MVSCISTVPRCVHSKYRSCGGRPSGTFWFHAVRAFVYKNELGLLSLICNRSPGFQKNSSQTATTRWQNSKNSRTISTSARSAISWLLRALRIKSTLVWRIRYDGLLLSPPIWQMSEYLSTNAKQRLSLTSLSGVDRTLMGLLHTKC